MLGRFNGYLKSVILRVSEARDSGEFDRFKFYDHSKSYIASPPDVLRVDEKNIREYSIPNVSGVIITTNHKTNGIFLPADDRRHYVAWSDLNRDSFEAEYWNTLWQWYDTDGDSHARSLELRRCFLLHRSYSSEGSEVILNLEDSELKRTANLNEETGSSRLVC
jgi:hypothetical protein